MDKAGHGRWIVNGVEDEVFDAVIVTVGALPIFLNLLMPIRLERAAHLARYTFQALSQAARLSTPPTWTIRT